MCGFAGYLCLGGCECVEHSLLEKMGQTLVHRGPDDDGLWLDKQQRIGFAFRRLSIVDLSKAGAQPMRDKENTVVICFNGQIYNHRALRLILEQRGYTYFSQCDTETLIYAYKEWGIGFLHKLEGMFAIALFDRVKNEFYLIRDRMGVKPLYFSLQGNKLNFASEIKALWHLPWIEKQANPLGLYHCLTYMATPAPMTLFKGVYKIPSSYYVQVDAQRNVSFHEWYSPLAQHDTYDDSLFNNEAFCIQNIQRLLRESVKKRMMADVPVGVFLSGGLDSTLNVALMSEFSTNVKTFNVAFSDQPENDERVWAKKVSQYYNTEHHEIVISEKEAFSFFEKMVYHQDEPITDCVCVPVYYVSHLARQTGVVVVQVGEGSDELYCGYTNYAQHLDAYYKYWKPSQTFVPTFARKAAAKLATTFFPRSLYQLSYLQNWAEGRNFFWSGAIAFPELYKKEFFHTPQLPSYDEVVEKIYPGFQQSFDSYAVVEYHLKKFFKQKPKGTFLDSMIYLELKQRLPELLLARVDKMTMAASVEGRVPFLDHKHVEFALRIPEHLKYKNGQTKYILKKAAESIVPHDIIYRKKIGFAAPTSRWFRSGKYFKDYFKTLIDDNKNTLEPWIDTRYVHKLLKEHEASVFESAASLWTIQNIVKALTQ